MRQPNLDELMSEHGDRIFRICRAYLVDPAEAEDLYQEVWINIWKALPRFRADAALTTFLYRITVNTAISHNRRLLTRWRAARELPRNWPPRSDTEAEEREARFAQLYRAIGGLPDGDRLLVGLLLEDLSYREIADVLGISVNYVGVKVNRVKAKLRAAVTVDS